MVTVSARLGLDRDRFVPKTDSRGVNTQDKMMDQSRDKRTKSVREILDENVIKTYLILPTVIFFADCHFNELSVSHYKAIIISTSYNLQNANPPQS